MNKKNILFGILAALVLAIFLSPFASSSPDGLERVAEDIGFLEKGEGTPIFKSPLRDYVWPGVDNDKVATSIAGAAGTLGVFALSYGVAALLKKKSVS